MTASPIIRKGVSSTKESREQFEELESLLDSQIYIVEDRVNLEEYIPSPKQICRFYDPVQIPYVEIKAKLECSWSKFDAILLGFQNSLSSGYKDTDDKFKSLRNRLANDHAKILFILENLGLLCAYEAVKVCIEMTPEVREECEVYKESVVQYKNFLQEVLSIIEGSDEHKKLLDVVNGGEEAMTTGQISPKLHELLEIFRSFGNDKEVLCIIFVDRIMTAKVIERLMCKITDLSHFNVSYLTGSNSSTGGLSPEAQKNVLESFRAGKVNLLFSTDVVEEGLDVAKCSCVIRFDLPKTVRSYIQSRGRARHKDSEYIIMLERGNTKQLDDMFYITRSENSMTQTAMNRNPDDWSIKACITKEEHVYVVGSTGASVTADSSVSLIHRYCQKLPGDKYFTPKPKFVDLDDGDLFRCRLILPPNAPFQTNIGPLAQNRHLAKQLVCLDACKKLHEMGALSDNLLPICDESSKKNTPDSKNLTSGAGTTKRKELHGSIKIRLLSGSLGDKLDSTSFHAYKMDFSCNIAEQKYSSFVLLLDAKLADDVGNIEVELYLLTKFVKASVSFCDQICLDSNQVARAKCFQELIFNGLFGKLFVKSSGVRKFLLQTEESLWAPSNMYLLLPLESEDIPLKINWTGIESCVSAVEFLRINAVLNFQKPEITDGNSSPVASDPPIATKFSDDNNVIHLANISASVDSLKEMVVVAIHTGRIYSILDSVANTSSESPFEGDSDTNYSSFADYYLKKYCIVLKHPEQPLLLLKQGHNSHNLLVDFRNEGAPLENKSDGKKVVEKPQQHAHMPPELLVGININTEILKSFYLLPSLMHRIESLMLASQLRDEISRHGCNFNISSSLILEALTTLRCNESFSMERLELLGDSVLKYAVSCHLFLKYPKKHEGQLSSIRSNIVCNSALHKLGTNRRLQEYVRDCAFDPRRWAAPGQRTIWPSPCDHGLEMTEVPLDDIKYYGEDKKLMLGKACDLGHRWMISKTISDCVESLIGAYYVGGGLNAALSLMKWLGVEAEIEHSLIDEAIKVASLYCYAPKVDEIGVIESKIGYKFCTKGLLLEAITHGTGPEQGVGYCYQRLEFLGDAVLDVLITLHLYENHRNVDPGELTDLRSASVNNDSFALAAVRWNLHPHLLHGSLHLDNQISAFVKIVSGMTSTASLAPEIKAPKALGDLVESITGAVFIDSKLDLEQVWKVMKPILSPIVTPDKLELQPSRELIELCDSLGYFIKENFNAKGDLVQVELKLQLEDVLLNGQGSGPTRKAARGMAALRILKQLEKRGITSSKRKKHETDDVDPTWSKDVETSESARKKQKVHELQQQQQPGINRDLVSSESTEIPVVPPIEMKKGGPRQSLYELCKKLQWPMPSFETMEQKSRTPIQIGDATGFNSFESQICLTIPDFGKIELTGEARADKKSSFDSAALVMLHELARRGKIVIGERRVQSLMWILN
ncbi:hypothetical protein ACP275_05G130300 [Erythranthe tilingii]